MTAEKITARRALWHQHIHAYQQSGLTQTAYCKEHKISVKTFSNWLMKTRRENQAQAGSGSGTQQWVSLPVPQPVASTNSEVCLRVRVGDYHLEIPQGFDQQTVAGVLRLIKELC